MAKNMTFSVSLKLLTKNFQNGIKSIQNSLGKLRQQFSTFVGGIGLGLGIQELVENAKNLDKAQTTLRNVSDGVKMYGANLQFVEGLSKKYNQELIVLMGNYSKFHSAASYAGMSLKDQQHIYEALTRASAYFNLTADETNGVMLAVQQMISKGRVSSEELRRQLGERLPGAMNLAAKAMGMTTAELDKQIRLGNIAANEMLPRLATELNKLTQNIDVNTMQGLTNKLKNTFTEFVKELGVEDVVKNLLGSLTSGLNWLTKHISVVAKGLKLMSENITAVLVGIGSHRLINNAAKSWDSFFDKIRANLTKTQTQVKIYKKELEDFALKNGIKYDIGQDGGISLDASKNGSVTILAWEEAEEHVKNYNKELKKSKGLEEQLNRPLVTMGKVLAENINKIVKIVALQAIYAAIAAAIAMVVNQLVKWSKEQRRIRNLVAETNAEYQKALNTYSPEESELELARDNLKIEEKRANAIEAINRLLGLEDKAMFTVANSNEEINKAIEERLKLLREEKEYEEALRITSEAQSKKKDLLTKRKAHEDKIAGYNSELESIRAQNGGLDGYTVTAFNKLSDSERKAIKEIDKEIAELDKIIAQHSETVARLGANESKRNASLNSGGELEPLTTDEDTLEKQYQKIQNEHNNKLRALNQRLADNVISQDDYDKAVKDLYFSTLESIYGLNDINENTDPFAKAIKDAVKVYLSEVDSIQETEAAIKEYKKKVREAKNQFANGAITQKELDEKLFDLLKEVVTTIGSFSALSGAAEELANQYKAEKRKKAREKLGEIETPKLGEYDSTFNYKKSNSEIYEDNADYIKDYTEQLEEFIDELKENRGNFSGVDLEMLNQHIDNLEEGLITLTAKAESFSEAAKFAEVQEDIKKLKGELAEGIFDNISNIATAAERLTNSWKTLTETMDDPDASGWEKFITIFTTIMSVIETVVGVVKAFQAVMAVAEALSLATAAAEQAGIPVKVQDAIATQAQAAAAKQLAIARHMSAAAAVPYPANIAAIASTAGALAAAFAALPAFAEGGIVRGASSVGDRNLVRVNAGEAILTKMQQANLWHLLNGQGALLGKGVGGNVEFKIRGADLVGTINNYSKKISK